MESRKPVVLIGIPCYGMVPPEVYEDGLRFLYHCGRRLPQYDFLLAIRTKAEQFRARQSIVDEGIRAGADWLLFLDDDMIVNPQVTLNPTSDYSLIEKLIAHNKDIVGALYFQRTGGCAPVAMTAVGEHGYRFLRDDELTGGLQEVDVAGGGALLIRMKVFDRLPHPYFAPEHKYGTDVQLCRAAKQIGIKTYLDSSIELGHVRDERVILTSRNKNHYAMEEAVPGDVKKMVSADVFNSVISDGLEYTGMQHMDDLAYHGQKFMTAARKKDFHANNVGSTLTDWYRQYPKERVARQIWFNTASTSKRQMTEFILTAVGDQIKADILDFGCGIGITALEFARRGHNVTACDINGTGTIDFLKWRCKKYGVPMTFNLTNGGVPHLGGAKFAAIIAMDTLEHIPEWKVVLREFADRLLPGGILFCNNGVLDDQEHPEHIGLYPKDFVTECVKLDLMPFNSIMYSKKLVAVPVSA